MKRPQGRGRRGRKRERGKPNNIGVSRHRTHKGDTQQRERNDEAHHSTKGPRPAETIASEANSRRDVLKKLATVGIPAVAVGVGAGAARNDGPSRRARGGSGDTNEPSAHAHGDSFSCGSGESLTVYDWDGDVGEFLLTDGTDILEITVTEYKDGSEPITFDWNTKGAYIVTRLQVFGGDDYDEAHPNDDTGTFESDLENPGGQQAAISNIRVCGQQAPPSDHVGYQVDIIHGEPIQQFDPESGVTYNSQERLLQAYWSGGGFDHGVGLHDSAGEYQHCLDAGLDIADDISVNGDRASAKLSLPADADGCSLDEFTLVSYSAPTEDWDPGTADEQEVWDVDLNPVVSEQGGTLYGSFEVDLPPV